MMDRHTFEYASDQAKVLVAPKHKIETFGSTVFNYIVITEEMDAINVSRVREGRIQAERPQIITPQTLQKLLLEGFGEEGERFAQEMSQHGIALLKYGFRIRKDELHTYEVHEPLEEVATRIANSPRITDDPLSAVLTGVDDGWEVSLLKLILQTVQGSAPDNLSEWRRRGLLP